MKEQEPTNHIVISAENVSIGYAKTAHREGVVLYADLSFNLRAGELTCLLGPNGSGKSTLLRTISAMQLPLKGNILLYGKSVSSYSESQLSNEVGVVLTDKTAVGGLTVSQLVALGRYPYTGFFGKLSKQDHAVVGKVIEDVGISHKSGSYMAELSDGERQKAMIAKALAQECPIILLDEPTAYLDIASRIEIMDLLHHLAVTQNKAVLLSTHDLESTLLFADRLWLLSGDKGLECGITEDILYSNSLEQFFKKNEITFDRQSGSFVPIRNFDRKVYLQADRELFQWVKNFLRRNSYEVAEKEEGADLRLKVLSENRFIVKKDSSEMEIQSFEELYNWLNGRI